MKSVTSWREIALTQCGLITRAQLTTAGVTDRKIERFIESERWQRLAPNVIGTTTGEPTDAQREWLGVLHGGSGAMVAGIHALARAGLKNWERPRIVILTPYREGPTTPLAGFHFIRTRRPLDLLRSGRSGAPVCRVEPAALLFASRERSARTAEGVLTAVVQQRLTSVPALLRWLETLKPLPRSRLLSRTLSEIGGGAESVAEIDVSRMCRRFRLAPPRRQVRRRDADGLLRYTDCEWQLPDGTVVVLEIDGLFHMEREHWESDLARQRALSAPDRLIIRCSAREIRDTPERIARDLRRLGVPAAA